MLVSSMARNCMRNIKMMNARYGGEGDDAKDNYV
jgi:hypothetical protein